jgi:hypothetical protein
MRPTVAVPVPRRKAGWSRASAVALALALAGCGDSPPDDLRAAPPGTVRDCGTFTLDQGEAFPAGAGRCLVEAVRQGRSAWLKVTRPTTEGDPIPVAYIARADGRVEVVEDTREDAWGEQTITREICTGPAVTANGLEFAGCD